MSSLPVHLWVLKPFYHQDTPKSTNRLPPPSTYNQMERTKHGTFFSLQPITLCIIMHCNQPVVSLWLWAGQVQVCFSWFCCDYNIIILRNMIIRRGQTEISSWHKHSCWGRLMLKQTHIPANLIILTIYWHYILNKEWQKSAEL